jgi:hypothetical protein
MRTFTLICSLLLLASCNPQPKPLAPAADRVHIWSNPDDSSPIIISDGSIHINHKGKSHFRIHTSQHASIKLALYQPYFLGFGCNPADGTATNACFPPPPAAQAKPCAALAGAPCVIDVNPGGLTVQDATKWELALCDSVNCPNVPTAKLFWDSKDHETIGIKYETNKFSVGNSPGEDSADLVNPNTGLKKATLTVTYTVQTPQPNPLPPTPPPPTPTPVPPPTITVATYSFTCPSLQMCLTLSYECHVSGNGSCGK